MDFPLILLIALGVTGALSLFDIVYLTPKRNSLTAKLTKIDHPIKRSWIIEYARSFFPIIFLVLVIRSFIIQPWRVPTGSLEPTVLPGDFIIVNQFAYGLRLPVFNTKILSINTPHVGDLAVFRWPKDQKIYYVKRVIGTPGDHIVYQNKELYINGEKAEQKLIGRGVDVERPHAELLLEKTENLKGKLHKILLAPSSAGGNDNFDIVVPASHYFVMGDNRDASYDSRFWGFVPESNLVGKPFAVLLSWNQDTYRLRYDRFVKRLT